MTMQLVRLVLEQVDIIVHFVSGDDEVVAVVEQVFGIYYEKAIK